jgi:hypothetical protein
MNHSTNKRTAKALPQVESTTFIYPDVTVSCTPENWQLGTNDIV